MDTSRPLSPPRRELPRLCSCPPDHATRGNEPQAADDVSAHAASDDTAHDRLVQAWWIRLEGVRAVAAPNTSAVGVMRPVVGSASCREGGENWEGDIS